MFIDMTIFWTESLQCAVHLWSPTNRFWYDCLGEVQRTYGQAVSEIYCLDKEPTAKDTRKIDLLEGQLGCWVRLERGKKRASWWIIVASIQS